MTIFDITFTYIYVQHLFIDQHNYSNLKNHYPFSDNIFRWHLHQFTPQQAAQTLVPGTSTRVPTAHTRGIWNAIQPLPVCVLLHNLRNALHSAASQSHPPTERTSIRTGIACSARHVVLGYGWTGFDWSNLSDVSHQRTSAVRSLCRSCFRNRLVWSDTSGACAIFLIHCVMEIQ